MNKNSPKKSIGLFGFGIWGAKIASTLMALPISLHVVEPLAEKRAHALSLGAKSVHKNSSSLPSLDGIIIATPSSSHVELIRQLAPLQIPLFVEKPLTTSYTSAKALGKLNHDAIFVMHIWKYHPGIQLLASIAKQGEIGKILGVKTSRTNWTSPRSDVSSLWNLAPHDLTIAETILGKIPSFQHAVVEKHQGIIRGMIALYGKEPWFSFEISNRYLEKHREVRIHGETGIARLKNEKVHYIELYKGNENDCFDERKLERIPFDTTSPLEIELRTFYTYLCGGNPPPTDLKEGIRIIKHLEFLESWVQCNH